MKKFIPFIVVFLISILVTPLARVETQAASPPRFREPSRIRIWNADSTGGTYSLTIRAGSDPLGPVVVSWSWILAPGEKREIDLATEPVIVSPFDGNGTIEATTLIGHEYFLPARTTNVTLHNLEDVATVVSLRYKDSAGKVVKSYTIPLAADGVLKLKEGDYPAGVAYTDIEFAAAQAIERYQSIYLPKVIR